MAAARSVHGMAIAHRPTFVIDCPDAGALARFYGAILDWPVSTGSDNRDTWQEIRGEGQVICFQQVDGYRAPVWPTQEHPQQMHLDVDVADLDEGEAAVIALGATKHEHQPGETFRVFLDPAGHPFCLCLS